MSLLDYVLITNVMQGSNTGNTVTLEDAGLFGQIIQWVLIGGLIFTGLFMLFIAGIVVISWIDAGIDKYKRYKRNKKQLLFHPLQGGFFVL